MIFTGAILLALIVTIICILMQRNINNDDYDEFLNEEGDHEYYDHTSIRYKSGIFSPKESSKMK